MGRSKNRKRQEVAKAEAEQRRRSADAQPTKTKDTGAVKGSASERRHSVTSTFLEKNPSVSDRPWTRTQAQEQERADTTQPAYAKPTKASTLSKTTSSSTSSLRSLRSHAPPRSSRASLPWPSVNAVLHSVTAPALDFFNSISTRSTRSSAKKSRSQDAAPTTTRPATNLATRPASEYINSPTSSNDDPLMTEAAASPLTLVPSSLSTSPPAGPIQDDLVTIAESLQLPGVRKSTSLDSCTFRTPTWELSLETVISDKTDVLQLPVGIDDDGSLPPTSQKSDSLDTDPLQKENSILTEPVTTETSSVEVQTTNAATEIAPMSTVAPPAPPPPPADLIKPKTTTSENSPTSEEPPTSILPPSTSSLDALHNNSFTSTDTPPQLELPTHEVASSGVPPAPPPPPADLFKPHAPLSGASPAPPPPPADLLVPKNTSSGIPPAPPPPPANLIKPHASSAGVPPAPPPPPADLLLPKAASSSVPPAPPPPPAGFFQPSTASNGGVPAAPPPPPADLYNTPASSSGAPPAPPPPPVDLLKTPNGVVPPAPPPPPSNLINCSSSTKSQDVSFADRLKMQSEMVNSGKATTTAATSTPSKPLDMMEELKAKMARRKVVPTDNTKIFDNELPFTGRATDFTASSLPFRKRSDEGLASPSMWKEAESSIRSTRATTTPKTSSSTTSFADKQFEKIKSAMMQELKKSEQELETRLKTHIDTRFAELSKQIGKLVNREGKGLEAMEAVLGEVEELKKAVNMSMHRG